MIIFLLRCDKGSNKMGIIIWLETLTLSHTKLTMPSQKIFDAPKKHTRALRKSMTPKTSQTVKMFKIDFL